jgi:hypothetical protein
MSIQAQAILAMPDTITVDGREIRVENIDVSRWKTFNWNGRHKVDVDRVYYDDSELTGERFIGYQYLRLNYDQEVARIVNPSGQDSADEVVWVRPDKAERELRTLTRRGLTPAEALDYWMVRVQRNSITGWAKARERSHQAISENVGKATEKVSAQL